MEIWLEVALVSPRSPETFSFGVVHDMMNDKLKELIQPYWVEEQQGVYIPLIDKVLLKDNVPAMSYYDYMEYAKSNGVQIATKDELLQMYLQRDQINKILEKHNGDMLDTWFGSSSKHGLYSEWLVNFGSGYCYYTSNHYPYVSRAVVNLKNQKKQNTKQFDIEKYLENPKQRVVTRDVDILPRLKSWVSLSRIS